MYTNYYVGICLLYSNMVNYSSGNIGRTSLHNPKNGQQRVVTDRDNNSHLEVFLTEAGGTIVLAKNSRIRSVESSRLCLTLAHLS